MVASVTPSHTPNVLGYLFCFPTMTGTLGSTIIELRFASNSQVVAPLAVRVLSIMVLVGKPSG